MPILVKTKGQGIDTLWGCPHHSSAGSGQTVYVQLREEEA